LRENFKIILILSIFICFIGILQFFGFITIDSRSYIAGYKDNIDIGSMIRLTSIFDEPASFSYFICLSYYISRYVLVNPKFTILFVFSLFLSLSMSALVTIFLIEIVNMNKKTVIKSLIVISIFLFLSYFTVNEFKIIIDLFYNRIANGKFGEYRTVAPIKALVLFSENIFTIFFGNGISSLVDATTTFNLSESASTTHNIFVDIVFELGLVGLFLYIFLTLSIIKNFKVLFTMGIFLMVGTGYRSGNFIILYALMLGSINIEKNKIENSRI
ncbi:hypothetical protein, partial [Oceanispirochaeta sp. M1]|uniref:hypothetical protein n=2 Tax=unclassified Oceanispirochaeta TaxID=2635722 RepID=UPI000E15D886